MGLFKSRSALAASSWLLMILALLILHVQAHPQRFGSRRHNMRRISHPSSKMQSASPSFLHPISIQLPASILKLPPPPKKFAYATIAPIPTKDDPNDQIAGFIQLVRGKLPLYPPAPYYEPTEAPKTVAPTTKATTTSPPATTYKPKTVKPYVRPTYKPKTVKPFVRPTRPYVRPPPPKPITTPKAIIFKSIKPSKNPFKAIQKVTKATPAPTSSTAAPSAAPELSPIVDSRGVGGEMMKIGATKAIAPVPVAAPAAITKAIEPATVTAPATIYTAAPAEVPSTTTAPATASTNAPATEEAVKDSTPIPLSFSSFQPRPFYRPAIYTRPPFRPHLQYTLLPKSTKAAPTSEDEKSIINVRVTLPTTTEEVPEIVTVKSEVLEPVPFDDFEIDKVLADVPQENIITEDEEKPDSSESTELPAVLPEELPIDQVSEEPIAFGDVANSIEDIETIPEEIKLIEEPIAFGDVANSIEDIETIPGELKLIEAIPILPESIEIIPEEPQIIESIPVEPAVEDEPEIFLTITDAPEIQKFIPEEPEITEIIQEDTKLIEIVPEAPEIPEFILDDPVILENIPFEPEIPKISEIPEIPEIPIELMVEDVVSKEQNSVEIIQEIPITFDDFPKVLEPEFEEPQIGEEEKLLSFDNIGAVFDPIFSDPANDIRLSIEETEIAEGPEADFDVSSISEDINKAVPIVAESPKIIKDVSEPDVVAQESPENLKALEFISGIEEEVEEDAPITEVNEAQLLLEVESQPFKRSHKYEPVWNIHTFGHGNKNSPPRSQSYPGWPELSSTTRKSLDYPTWLQSTTLSPFARNVPDWPQDITTQRGYVFSKWSPQLKNGKKTTADNLKSEETSNPEIKTLESSTKKSTKQNTRRNNLRTLGRIRGRFRTRTSTVKPTTKRGTLPDTLTNIKSTTVKPPTISTLPTWDEIQTRKASKERTSSETKEASSGLDAGFSTGLGTGIGGWGDKI